MIPNEPSSGGAPPPPPPPGGDFMNEEQPSMMPLGTGSEGIGDADAMLDPLAGGGVKKRIPTGPLLIVLVLIVAVVGLFSMRTIGQAFASTSGNEELEDLVSQFFAERDDPRSKPNGDRSLDGTKAIDMLAAAYTEQQVALRDVQKNPFVIHAEREDPVTKDPVRNIPVDDTAERIAAFNTKAKAAANNIVLSGVFMGSTPMATIDGEITMVGDDVVLDRVELVFTVTNIKQGSVDLECVDPDTGARVDVTVTLDGGIDDKKKKRSGRR